MQDRLKKLSDQRPALVIFIIGLVVFCTGLFNPFQGDDFLQIVKNVPVHSLTNIKLFFEGGTLYNGGGLAPLSGDYRPLMTTAFSVIYTFFGLHVFFYHIIQLLLYIGSAIILYHIFSRLFKSTVLALALSLVFMVHPLNSQVVFAIPSLQDVLFFFFGILGFYILITYKSIRSLSLVALCFFLSLLSKETSIVFIGIALVYLFWWGRKRLATFATYMIVPVGLWLLLRVNAVGLNNNPNIAPIDRLNLASRLLTMPSIIQFYIAKFIFPWRLASGYYWVHTTFSVRYVLIPLFFDLIILGIAIYLAFAVRRRAGKILYHKYLFFFAWVVLGILTLIQIIPLDMTASETWFYFPMAGLLGMIGVLIKTYKNINTNWFLTIAMILIVLFGFRSFIRGIDWSNKYHLDKLDIKSSRQDYVAYNDIANTLINQHKYITAKTYTKESIAIFPYFGNYNNLGAIYMDQDNVIAAKGALDTGTSFGHYVDTYENLAEIALVYGNYSANNMFFGQALRFFPQDGKLWFYKALFDSEHNDNIAAQTDLKMSEVNGYQVNAVIYAAIMTRQTLAIHTNLGVINVQ